MDGEFPDFIPKTDEPNYQNHLEMVEALLGHPYYMIEKCDGSSTTAYKYKSKFGLCSQNLELMRNEDNVYWKVAIEHNLEENLPEGIALQWETCGPDIQSNPMGLPNIQGFAFSAYDIFKKEYLNYKKFSDLCTLLQFPIAKIVAFEPKFFPFELQNLGHGYYDNGSPREGVVVRSQENLLGNKPISFKVINLDYGT